MFELGLYEQLINKEVLRRLDALDSKAYFIDESILDREEAAAYLSRYISNILSAALKRYSGDAKTEKQIELCNKIILLIKNDFEDVLLENNLIETQGRILNAVLSKVDNDFYDLDLRLKEITPYSRFSQSELFTGKNCEITLESEIKKEILSSDEVFFLVSFIKWTGIRIFEKELREFTEKGGKLKIITTSYMGATDVKAVEFLASLKNTEIKISYNTLNERLHAKAYLFVRKTGFDTGYIGSSNISKSALTSGLEWNIKITTQEINHIIDKFKKTFESYWLDSDFELFHIDDREKLSTALRNQKNQGSATLGMYFDITPFPFQKEVLEHLVAERNLHNRYKNLVVAATGTGKTVISAFDFKAFRITRPDARLLFVAHRKEILEQAQATFRGILRDNNFGELWVDGQTPTNFSIVFASIQTLNNRLETLSLSPEYYDYIVIDEVHHIAASSYRPILAYFNPNILLGLTATPDRMDGEDILADFDNAIASEIRLSEALNRKLLCPFQYFGITDSIDLSSVEWKRGGYVKSELSNIYTGNDQRVGNIIDNLEKYLTDIHDVRALGFCVSIEHAKYMSDKFNQVGLKAEYLVSDNRDISSQIKLQLLEKKINYLFVVDIFNEGVDIPEIDTVLFLRPTESLTVFLQQLGRGLRLAEGKECLTVLDFVGNSRPEYNFENKFRALVGKTNSTVQKEIEDDFPHLPLGSAIILEKKAKEYILQNIQNAINFNKKQLINKVINFRNVSDVPLTLKSFTEIYNIPLQLIYSKYSWSGLCYESHLGGDFDRLQEETVRKAIWRKWLYCNSATYLTFIRRIARELFVIDYSSLNREEQIMSLMLYYDLFAEPKKFISIEDAFKTIGGNKTLVKEIIHVLDLLINEIDFIEYSVSLGYDMPLRVHSRYTKDQILCAFGAHTFETKRQHREGVLNLSEKDTEIFFITLKKSEKDYSPTTLYEDYAVNETLFHWQSQNLTGPETNVGKSYIDHEKIGKKILLFVRESNQDEFNNTQGFIFLGDAKYVSHYGQKPMSINWELREPIPSYIWKESAKLSAG